MKRFFTFLKTELKLSLRDMNMPIFAVIMPLVIFIVLGVIYGTKPAYDGADYMFLEQSFGAAGTTLPLEVMPRAMQKIVSLFPLTQGITMMKNAFIGADTGNGPLPVCVMLALTALCTALSIRLFRWE